MTLQERLKQLKAGADRQAVELGHEDASSAAKAGGRVAGGLLWKVVAGVASLAWTLVLNVADNFANSKEDSKSWSAQPSGEWSEGLGGEGPGYYGCDGNKISDY
ncbi:hypothetical protein QWY79_08430 [Halomonas sabkhae]|uniref:hypothetical protein n=1 Tax=Halomonas sabkhae TaxID=626223 RepID=UPI0025B530D5|nr:hypothetical protein [Halomonas sabkhae]MDN3525297.1 hypothetical protein [Halomonas sabkhae]